MSFKSHENNVLVAIENGMNMGKQCYSADTAQEMGLSMRNLLHRAILIYLIVCFLTLAIIQREDFKKDK